MSSGQCESRRRTPDSPELVVLLMTMDMAPFDWIYKEGAAKTWLQHLPAGVKVVTYAGMPIPGWRRPLSAVRERLRFLGANRVDLALAGRRTWLVALTDRVMLFAFTGEGAFRRLLALMVRATARGLRAGEWLSGKARVGLPQVQAVSGDRRVVRRSQTLANMLDIQLAVFQSVSRELDPDGYLVLTLSTYLDAPRALEWHRAVGQSGVPYASLASSYAKGRLFSGGCMYFSRSGMQDLLASRHELARGVLNDVAITEWMKRTGRGWGDLPVLSLSDTPGLPRDCPLCANPEVFAVRCTSHKHRTLEIARMALLDAHAREHVTH